LHATSQTQNQMKSGFLLDVVVGQSATVFQLLASKDQTLLVGRDAFFVLDFCFDIFNGVAGFNFKGDGLSGESFDKDLHATSQTQNQMESRLLLDVVIGQSTTVFQLLASKDQTLLIGWDTFLVLDFRFDIFNGVTWFNFKGDGLPSESFDKDLHATSQTKNQMEGRLLLDVVVRQSATIFQLLAGKDQTLLIRWDTFFVLDLCFDILDGVTWFNFEGDGLPSESFDKDLHATSQTKNQMEGRLLLDVVVGQSAAIFQLLASKDKTLLIGWDTFFVLDLCFDILDRVTWFNFKGDRLPSESFDKNLHATSQTKNQMEG